MSHFAMKKGYTLMSFYHLLDTGSNKKFYFKNVSKEIALLVHITIY